MGCCTPGKDDEDGATANRQPRCQSDSARCDRRVDRVDQAARLQLLGLFFQVLRPAQAVLAMSRAAYLGKDAVPLGERAKFVCWVHPASLDGLQRTVI
jgi:hypothetical protein